MAAEALPFAESNPPEEARVILTLLPALEEPAETLMATLLRDGASTVIYHGDGYGRYDMSGQFFTARAWAAYKSAH